MLSDFTFIRRYIFIFVFMKVIFRNIFLTFCLTVYCSLIFSSTLGMVSSEGNSTKITFSQEAYLSELSKIIFPQTVNPNGGAPMVPLLPDLTPKVEPALCAIQLLNKMTVDYQVNYLKGVEYLVLKYSPADIIYPYHSFW